jgi:hypothetical protein
VSRAEAAPAAVPLATAGHRVENEVRMLAQGAPTRCRTLESASTGTRGAFAGRPLATAWRGVIASLFGLMLLLVTGSGAGAQQSFIAIEPPPQWVQPVTWERSASEHRDRAAGGLRYLLYERQEHIALAERFHRVATLLLHQEGAESLGNLRLDFDPGYETLALHHVRIHRGEAVLDRLDLGDVRVIQPERDLDANVYTGMHTAAVFLEDLRVGDVLEYAYTARGRDPVMAGHFWTRCSIRWGAAVDHVFHRIVGPAGKPLHRRSNRIEVQPEIRDLDDRREFVWELRDQPGLQIEGHLPARIEPFFYVEVGDFADWADVVDWALPLYPRQRAAESADLRDLVDRWEARWGFPTERALAAIRFVQDEIRYLGIELGLDSHRPSPPGETLRRRFGDCKDKAYLLCALLGEMGIEAWPVLVSSRLRGGVGRRLPSPFAFDHVIVQLRLERETCWVDPTLQQQGGTATQSYLPPYGLGLVIRPGSTELEPVRGPANQRSLQRVLSRFKIEDYGRPAALRITTVYRGGEADSMRRYLGRTAIAELERSYVDFYSWYYPGIQSTGRPAIDDQRLHNVLTVIERYEVPDLWEADGESGEYFANFHPESLDDVLPAPSSRRRRMPLAIPYPLHREHEVVVELPEAGWGEGWAESVECAAFRFRFQLRVIDRVVRFCYYLETSTSEIAAERVPEYLSKLEAMENLLGDHLTRGVGGPVGYGDWHPNWMMVVVAALGGLVLVAGSLRLLRYSVQGQREVPIPLPGEEHLQGLGGWLVLVGIGVCLRPLVLAWSMLSELEAWFSIEVWQEMASPRGSAYHPLGGPLIVGVVLAQMALLALGIVLVILFFRKSHLFPQLFLFTISLSILIAVVFEYTAWQIPQMAAESESPLSRETRREAIWAVIWILYTLRSRRVRLTFVW